ncbi:NAD(P)/FAD-dependent oxidoreductase [Rhodococcus sp. NPDC127530]|uniref:NAD(P)/FAD-dependent oxidoreductase n=1 Tax=unclassified Rhodococcus (in: high G+C Gram-positive bacteria) TaxID=192944 RepID=UPI003630CEFF
MTTGVLVVGAGQSGFQVATSLRTQGYDGRVTIVGDEPFLPYQRPPLSKGIGFDGDGSRLTFRPREFYASQVIDLVLGDGVDTIDLDGVALTRSGRELPFDRLVLATGAEPRRLRVPGADADGVVYLRTLPDASTLAAAAATISKAVVVGAGYIGLEIASAMRQRGIAVTVVAQSRLLSRTATPILADYLLAAHTKRGVVFELERTVERVHTAKGRARGVVLDDGRLLDADIVIVGIGAQPRTELAQAIGLELALGGVVVDEFSRTSNPLVVAAGDVTTLRREGHERRFESVQNAVDQAKTAAATLLGSSTPNDAVPWFWSDQGDLKLKTAGWTGGYDEAVVHGEMSQDRFSIRSYADGRLVSVESINSPAEYMSARRELAATRSWEPSALTPT